MADDKKKKKKAPPALTPEQRKTLAQKQLIGADMALDFRDQAHFYHRAAELLAGIPDDPDCAAQAAEYRAKGDKIAKDGWEAAYQEALSAKEVAVTADDFSQAESAFQRLAGYRDADEQAAECERHYLRLSRKGPSPLVWLGLLVALLVAVGVVSQTNLGQYQFGRLCLSTSFYDRAVDTFTELGAYRDSAQQRITAETAQLQASTAGDTVFFGDAKWLVLDAQTDRMLLLLKQPLDDAPSYHDQAVSVPWPDSALCQWLNDTWAADLFAPEELALLHTSDANSNVFLLSQNQWETYASVIPSVNRNWWLRTAGTSDACAMFVSPTGIVMEYGYPVTSADLSTRPAVWVNYQ